MLTGGFRTVTTMEDAIANGALDVVGLARPFTLYPDLPNQIFKGNLERLDIPNPKTGLKMFDSTGFVDIMWHEIHIHRLGAGKKPNPNLSAYSVLSHNLSATFQKLFFDLPLFKKSTKRGF